MSAAVFRSNDRVSPQVPRWSELLRTALGRTGQRKARDAPPILGGSDRHLLNDIGVSWCEITTAQPTR